MTDISYVELPGSHRPEPPGATRIVDVAPEEPVEVSVYLVPHPDEADFSHRRTRAELNTRRAAGYQNDIQCVLDFAREAELSVVSVEPGRRLLKLRGPAARIEAAFSTKLGHYHDGKHYFRGRAGPLRLPDTVAPVVEAVLGLDTRPIAEAHIIRFRDAAAMPGYLPNQIGSLYDFPAEVSGAGQCIALIELGGGYLDSDTQDAFKAMGIPPPRVVAVPVDQGLNQPDPRSGADDEVALDIQVAGGVAPGATIAVYFTPNTDAGFVNAITAAAHDTTHEPGVISISWGSAEMNWTPQALRTMNSALRDAAMLGVAVFAAAGDNLATDGINDGKAHVDFPASSPWAVGCGGTSITVTDHAIVGESVWNDGEHGTGGGISDVFPVPDFQKTVVLPPGVNGGHPGRGVPDVAADAAPAGGYIIVVHGHMTTVGGTSAVAPLWGGLTLLINEKAAQPLGFFLPELYRLPHLLREVTVGNNWPAGSDIGYQAGRGWNACTGLGVPRGKALFQELALSGVKASLQDDLLAHIRHIVVLMLENRSFDHMLGLLYADRHNVSPAGHPFDGLTGRESNPDVHDKAVRVFPIEASQPYAYFMPGADPGEGYAATNAQLFGTIRAPVPPVATNQGFVRNYAYTLGWEKKAGWSILPDTRASGIMGIFTPEMLPVLSGLARGYAVCDRWFSSVPTETLPNRAFACAATAQGHMDDKTKRYTCPTIFGLLSRNGIDWAIYGYDADPLTRYTFSDITHATESHFGRFSDFMTAAANGSLPAFSFLEPSWDAAGNSQHPNYDVALGEKLIHDVYYAVRNGPAWNDTLLIITYDEHGGCYDHVPAPTGAVPPDDAIGEYGFDFTRFGVRVPTVLISPRIQPGTVFRVPDGFMPLDHTTVLKTVERRWNLPPLTRRDAAAPDIGAVLTLAVPRTDDPLAGVQVPSAKERNPNADAPSHLQQIYAELVAQLPVPDAPWGDHALPPLSGNQEYQAFIQERITAWKIFSSGGPAAGV
ncbi:MAG TPA: alkaline phosphatase family protein [Burkholderiales bacterium]|nr:alkaline phosphatase family protein [Burkholderiales bacterium]